MKKILEKILQIILFIALTLFFFYVAFRAVDDNEKKYKEINEEHFEFFEEYKGE